MKINKWMDPVHKSFTYLIVVIFGLMVIVGFFQVTNRYLLNSSLSWSEEFQKFAHIWIICLTIPVAYKHSAHLGMDIITKRLSPKNKVRYRQIVNLLWLFVGVILAIYSMKLIIVAVNQLSPGLGISMAWVYAGLFIGNVYLVATAIQKLAENSKSK